MAQYNIPPHGILSLMNQSKTSLPLYTDLHHSSSNYELSDEEYTSYDINLSSLIEKNFDHDIHSQPCPCDDCRKKYSFIPDESYIEDVISDKSQSNISSVKTEMSEVKSSNFEQQRIINMVNLRHDLADRYLTNTPYLRPKTYHDKFICTFSKGLPHDVEGFVNINEINKLITALTDHNIEELSKVKLGSKSRLVNPSAAWSEDLIGKNSNSYRYSKLPSFSSDMMAAQMAELYCMSLCRDIPFNRYNTDNTIADCCNYLNDLRSYPQTKGKITPYNIYRGPMYGDLQGPYISQFLYRDVKIFGSIQKQKYPYPLEGHDFMKTWDTAIKAQNGSPQEELRDTRQTTRYIITGRDLACYVHSDKICQPFYNAYMVLLDMKVPMNPSSARLSEKYPVEDYFINLGQCDVQTTLNIVARNALLAAWYVKWNTLFLRPEAYGIEVERVYRDNRNKYGVSHELLINPVIEAVRARNGSALLTQAYEEGAPLHPSTPSGHATIAGACATVLKFFFDVNHEIDIYEPDTYGNNLINTGKRATIGGEINKLACNMGIGRCWAGVNFYMDVISGLKRGEKVALSCLQELICRYPVSLSVNITRFNDTVTTIHN